MRYEISPQATDGPKLPICRNRSIEAILARHQARLRRRKHVFPPDFIHGRVRVDEIYEVFGERFVEGAVFVERFYDEQGELAAFTAAWFEGRFLNVEQAVRDEVDDLPASLDEIVSGRRSVIELCLEQRVEKTPQEEGELVLRCTLERLLALERDHLALVRDKRVSHPSAIYSQRDDVLQDSRTNILSVVCLCARLATEATPSKA